MEQIIIGGVFSIPELLNPSIFFFWLIFNKATNKQQAYRTAGSDRQAAQIKTADSAEADSGTGKPPTNAPAIPRIIVMTNPPGYFPGMINFAIIPIINPMMNQERRPVIPPFSYKSESACNIHGKFGNTLRRRHFSNMQGVDNSKKIILFMVLYKVQGFRGLEVQGFRVQRVRVQGSEGQGSEGQGNLITL